MLRTEFGFERTVRGGWEEVLNCQHIPGYLVAADIERMAAAAGATDVLAWAKVNLLASPGALVMDQQGRTYRIPTLVPARKPNGHCRFLTEDCQCSIHAAAPFGCAFVDTAMTREQVNTRSEAALRDVARSWRDGDDGYADLWMILEAMGRVAPGPEESRKGLRAAYEKGRP